MIGIGIDTGGTCTDAVVYDMQKRCILAAGKALTTKSNLELGIENALSQLPEEYLKQAGIISLSTTLATNACVENKGCRAKLLFIGAAPELIKRLQQTLSQYGITDISQIVAVDAKAENMFSNPFDPDWEDLRRRIPELFSDCDAIGIVQTFPRSNGGRFELTALRILREELSIPLTTAFDISKETDILKVCASTLLNARLIPLISEFIEAVRHIIKKRRLNADIFIVRSDGTLMSEDMARICPVETLLCGPAASVIGGSELSRQDNAIIVDMGGTTTDIALIQDRRPAMSKSGIMIGHYQTSIKGLDAKAMPLGGDTAVRFRKGELYLESQRIIPISVLASHYDNVLPALEDLAKREHPHTRWIHEFYVLQKDISGKSGFTEFEKKACQLLQDGPLITLDFANRIGTDIYHLDTSRLEEEGILIKSGLTPTDAMALKGDLKLYDTAAAQLLSRYLAMNLSLKEEDIPEIVYKMVIKSLYKNLGLFLLQQQYPKYSNVFQDIETDVFLEEFYQQAVARENGNSYDISNLFLSTALPIVGVGAPTHVFLPAAARLLGTRAIIPEYAMVANAAGAAAGNLIAQTDVIIYPEYDVTQCTGYYVMADCRREMFTDAKDAILFAEKLAKEEIRRLAGLQGMGSDYQLKSSVQEKRIGDTANGFLTEIILHAEAVKNKSDNFSFF